MHKLLSKLMSSLEIVKILAEYEPLYLLFALPQIIVNALIPFLYVYFPKIIIEKLTDSREYQEVAKVVMLYGLILLFTNLINVFLKNKSEMCSIIFSSKLKKEIGSISMRAELSDIESPRLQEIIKIANKAGDLTKAFMLIQNIISSIITVIGLSYIIVRLDWLFILLVSVTLTVKIIFVRLQYNNRKKVREAEVENSRYVEYLLNLSYFSEGGAKEIRLNSLQNWYMKKTKAYRDVMVGIHFKSFLMNARHNIITAVFLALQSFVILWLLSGRYINGMITIADFTMYFSAVIVLTEGLSSMTEQFGDYNQQILNVDDYKKFLRMTEGGINHYSYISPNFIALGKIEFEFQNVSFTYPNTDIQVLKNINIKISDKEKLVIVGTNGAGKSTFIKLLCKFYRPSNGKILLNGIDIWDISNEEYYKVISAVFQDFSNFSFTIGENISMNGEGDVDKISKTITTVGLAECMGALFGGYSTYLSRSFDPDGIELSGGQAQKIAIARAVYKDTPVLILDEPTANLDPKAESEIYSDFFSMVRNKTAVFISHRLAASSVADHVAVFSDGRIAEYGSHNDLINQNGIYAEMYRKQSQYYIDEKKIF